MNEFDFTFSETLLVQKYFMDKVKIIYLNKISIWKKKKVKKENIFLSQFRLDVDIHNYCIMEMYVKDENRNNFL